MSILRRDSFQGRESLQRRNSRTVSFNERCTYRELHRDGTCDVTDLLLREDMELTTLEVVENVAEVSTNSFDVSMQMTTLNQTTSSSDQSAMDLTLVNNHTYSIITRPANDFEPINNNSQYNASTLFQEKMSLVSDISSINSTLEESMNQSKLQTSISSEVSWSPSTVKAVSMISDISCNTTMMGNNTLLDAFQDTLDQSVGSYMSTADTLMHNVQGLDFCLKDIEEITESGVKKLNNEMQHLLRFHRHVVGRDNRHEFAIRILGINYPIWIIFLVNPKTYPDEEIKLRFAVKKCDLNLYPWATFHAAIKKVTRKSEDMYLIRLTRNIKLFVKFLKKLERVSQ